MNDSYQSWLAGLPKAELHLHIDGSLQAGRMLALAEKNKITLPYQTVEQVYAAYEFEDLQSFLDLYYLGASVLREEEDFYHLMMDYLKMCQAQNIVHCEIMVEPQTYAPYGVSFATMMRGFTAAINDAQQQWGQSCLLILSLLRHLDEADALTTLEQAADWRDQFCAIGLASAESGNPPAKFEQLYSRARAQGYRATAHAGEEGPPAYIRESLDLLRVERIDHGVRCLEDPALVSELVERQIPLTVCPLSNVRLCVFDSMREHTVLKMLEQGLCVTINSDDPTYFGGFLNENFTALNNELDVSRSQTIQLLKNSFSASFLAEQEKQKFIHQLTDIAGV